MRRATLIASAVGKMVATGRIARGALTALKLIRPLNPGGFEMKKIVMFADDSELNITLRACLSLLFPECEIQTIPRQMLSSKVPLTPYAGSRAPGKRKGNVKGSETG